MEKLRIRQLCEAISTKLGQLYQNQNFSIRKIEEWLVRSSGGQRQLDTVRRIHEELSSIESWWNEEQPTYSFAIDSVIELCIVYLEKYFEVHQTLFTPMKIIF